MHPRHFKTMCSDDEDDGKRGMGFTGVALPGKPQCTLPPTPPPYPFLTPAPDPTPLDPAPPLSPPTPPRASSSVCNL